MIEVRPRHELRAESQQAMSGLDIVLTATQPAEAAKIDAVPKWDLFDRPNFTMPFNVAGYPAISICAGVGIRHEYAPAATRQGHLPGGSCLPGGREPDLYEQAGEGCELSGTGDHCQARDGA